MPIKAIRLGADQREAKPKTFLACSALIKVAPATAPRHLRFAWCDMSHVFGKSASPKLANSSKDIEAFSKALNGFELWEMYVAKIF